MRKRITIALAGLAFGTADAAMAQDASPVHTFTAPATTLRGFDQPKPALKLDASGDRVADFTPRRVVVRDGSIAGLVEPNGSRSDGTGTRLVGTGASGLAVALTVVGVRAAIRGVDELIDCDDDK